MIQRIRIFLFSFIFLFFISFFFLIIEKIIIKFHDWAEISQTLTEFLPFKISTHMSLPFLYLQLYRYDKYQLWFEVIDIFLQTFVPFFKTTHIYLRTQKGYKWHLRRQLLLISDLFSTYLIMVILRTQMNVKTCEWNMIMLNKIKFL